jgi:hypothetical protein
MNHIKLNTVLLCIFRHLKKRENFQADLLVSAMQKLWRFFVKFKFLRLPSATGSRAVDANDEQVRIQRKITVPCVSVLFQDKWTA